MSAVAWMSRSEDMANDTTVEALIERCVAAGVAARLAHIKARTILDVAIARRTELTPEESARIAPLEAETDRLSRAYVEAQRPLAEAGPSLFQARMAEVQHRIAERLK